MKDILTTLSAEILAQEEGLRTKVYTCPAGKLTIGYGRNLEDNGITEDEAKYLLMNDIKRVKEQLEREYLFYRDISTNRKFVLISMCFQLGFVGFKKFKNFISALIIKDYEKACYEMKNSKWYQQTPQRVERLIKAMREG